MEKDGENRWLLALISDTGMRLSEAVGLHVNDIMINQSIPFVCRALTYDATKGFCTASFPRPISTKAPFYANRDVVFNKHKRTPIVEC